MIKTRLKKNEKGITLIEQVTVLAIVAILSSLTFVGVGFVRGERIIGISRELLRDLQGIRLDTMIKSVAANSRGFGIRFVDNSSYVVFEFDDCNNNSAYDANGCNGNREEANSTTRELNPSISLLINNVYPDNNILIFDKLGIPREDNWALWNNGSGTLLVQRTSSGDADTYTTRCVNINMSRIQEGVWDGANCQGI